MTHANLSRAIDTALVLRPAASAAIAAAATGSESTSVDLGPGYHRFDTFLDVVTAAVADADDLITVKVLGSNDATPFSSQTLLLGTIQFGHATALGTSSGRGVGEYVLPCHNIGKDAAGVDVNCRHIKIGWTAAGTTVSFDFNAWASKRT